MERKTPATTLSDYKDTHTRLAQQGLSQNELKRRVVYLMIFRLVIITLILCATIVLSLASKDRGINPATMLLLFVLVVIYAMTIIYALFMRKRPVTKLFGRVQIVADLVTTTALVHLTGGAQSAYTFLFPLAIIGATRLEGRSATIQTFAFATLLFTLVSLLGWLQLLPTPMGQWVLPYDFSRLVWLRYVVLNIVAFSGVAFLAVSLAGEIATTKESLASERAAAADFLAIHEDIVRSLESGLITINGSGQVTTCNQVARDILKRRDTIVGKQLSRILPGIEKNVEKLDVEHSLKRSDLKLQVANEPKHLGISISPLRDKNGEVIGRVVNFQDLTGLKEMEAQVKQAERLATLGSLAAGVAHEIRNPLASISGSVEMLAGDETASADNQRLMSIVIKEIDRLNGLITDLLDYTNPTKKQTVDFDMKQLVEETVSVGSENSNTKCRINFVSQEGKTVVNGDPNKIKQVVWNLINNAVQASSKTSDGDVDVVVRRETERCILEVTDNGPGIPTSDLGRIFEPFFSTKEKGTGLGLATCHSIVTEHDGMIWAESKEGEGATFTVALPLSDEET